MLKKTDTLSGRYRIEKLLKKGRKIESRFFILRYAPNYAGRNYFGFIISKKTDPKAVNRNLVKRRLAEAIRLYKNTLPLQSGFDMLLVVRKAAIHASFSDLEGALKKIFATFSG